GDAARARCLEGQLLRRSDPGVVHHLGRQDDGAYPGAEDDRPGAFHAPGLRTVQPPLAGAAPRMRRALVLALVAAALVVPAARADGDPASDFLITQQVF